MQTGTDKRVGTITYQVDTSRWFLHLKKNETWVYNGAAANPVLNNIFNVVTREFDGAANLMSETHDRVTTGYTYFPTGDLNTRTDARNGVTTYTDYLRGVPQSEVQPEGVKVTRLVDDAGDINSITDGELATTSYHYDGLDRVSYIGHPLGNPVNIVWSPNTRTVTRGNFKEDATYDEFGRQTKLLYTDTTSGEITRSTNQFDAAGNRIFSSYPNGVLAPISGMTAWARCCRSQMAMTGQTAWQRAGGSMIVSTTS